MILAARQKPVNAPSMRYTQGSCMATRSVLRSSWLGRVLAGIDTDRSTRHVWLSNPVAMSVPNEGQFTTPTISRNIRTSLLFPIATRCFRCCRSVFLRGLGNLRNPFDNGGIQIDLNLRGDGPDKTTPSVSGRRSGTCCVRIIGTGRTACEKTDQQGRGRRQRSA